MGVWTSQCVYEYLQTPDKKVQRDTSRKASLLRLILTDSKAAPESSLMVEIDARAPHSENHFMSSAHFWNTDTRQMEVKQSNVDDPESF